VVDDAIPHLEKAVALLPSDGESHYKLANAYFERWRLWQAVAQYEEARKLRPDYAAACNNLAWILATSPVVGIRDGPRAIILALHAEQFLGSNNPVVAGTLASA